MTEKYYFICSLDGLDLNSKEVPRMRFLKRGRSWRNPSSFSEDISEGMPLVYSRLSMLVEDFVLGGQKMTDTASMAMLAKRLKTLVTRLIVARYTTTGDSLSFIESRHILEAARRLEGRINKVLRRPGASPGSYMPMTSPLLVPKATLAAFTAVLHKCFGAYSEGTLSITTRDYSASWDVCRADDRSVFRFGALPIQDFIFRVGLGELFTETAGCTVRVHTDQSYQGIPFHELYGFLLCTDRRIEGVDFLSMERAYNTDAKTGKPLSPENNVIYCDLEGHKLPSFEID
jgi:hypothetical protein